MAEQTGGWVKLNYNIIKWGWYQDGNTMRVFLHLILIAMYDEAEFKGVKIHRGEVATSYNSIAKALSLTYDQVRTAFEHLKSTGEITVKQYSKFQVVSIANYNKYQSKNPVKNPAKSQSSPSQVPRKAQNTYLKGKKKERKKEALRADAYAWEDELNVPEAFRGRFMNEREWLAFIGEDDGYGL